jgi:hypothetical protein
MGCCGQTLKDRDIQNAVNMSEIINIMMIKKDNLLNEKEQIQKHLENHKHEVTLAKIDDLSEEELTKRIPYLDKLAECYHEVIIKLKSEKNVNISIYMKLINDIYSYLLWKQKNIYIILLIIICFVMMKPKVIKRI